VGLVDPGFTVVVKDKNGVELTGRRVTWQIDPTSVATIADDGKITAVALGTATVRATVEGRSANAVMKVIQRVHQLIVNPDSIDLPLGQQKQITTGILDEHGAAIPGRQVTWTSNNTTIAVVSTTGQVSPLAEGETQILATVSDKQATVKVRVLPELCDQVLITSPTVPSVQLRLGGTLQITALPVDRALQPLPGKTINFQSSNDQVATVDQTGLVTSRALGSTTITAECDLRTKQIQVQVTPVPVASVSVNPTSLTILDGQSFQFTVIPKDAAGNVLPLTGHNVNWQSENVLVASVQNNGVLTAQSKGTTNVQVFVDQVPSPLIPVTVTVPPVVSVQITPPSAQLSPPPGPGATSIQLGVILRDAAGNQLPIADHPVTWSSSDPTVATVTANGFVQALKVGGVLITATSEGVSSNASIVIK
jgi:uncharacterized protein YjdB